MQSYNMAGQKEYYEAASKESPELKYCGLCEEDGETVKSVADDCGFWVIQRNGKDIALCVHHWSLANFNGDR